MQIATHSERRFFLKEHPPVIKRFILNSTGEEKVLIAGNVIGRTIDTLNGEQTIGEFVKPQSGKTCEVVGILAEDVTIPATGDAYAAVYVHAEVIASQLVWSDDVSANDKKAALEQLRKLGIFEGEQ